MTDPGGDDDDGARTLVGMAAAPRMDVASTGHFVSFVEDGKQRLVPIGASGLTIGRTAPADLVKRVIGQFQAAGCRAR